MGNKNRSQVFQAKEATWQAYRAQDYFKWPT